MRTVGSSILKLKAELGNISLAVIWQAKSYIEPLIGFAGVAARLAPKRNPIFIGGA